MRLRTRGGIKRPDHRLDRADAGRSDREILRAQADQRHGLQRPSGHFAADAHRHLGRPRRVEHPLQEPQDRRAQPVVALREPRIGAVGGKQELGKVVRPDRQEIDPRKELVEHLGKRGHFHHRAEFDLRRQFAMRLARPVDLLLEQSARFFIFPGFGDHREHHAQDLAAGRLDQRPRLRPHQRRAVERQPQRAPAHRGVFGLVVDIVGR